MAQSFYRNYQNSAKLLWPTRSVESLRRRIKTRNMKPNKKAKHRDLAETDDGLEESDQGIDNSSSLENGNGIAVGSMKKIKKKRSPDARMRRRKNAKLSKKRKKYPSNADA